MNTLAISEYTPEYILELEAKAQKYTTHLLKVATYQKANPEKIKQNQANHYKKIKQECPDKYFDMLEKKKQYYKENVKPKRQNNTLGEI
jgi:hypothetical protein